MKELNFATGLVTYKVNGATELTFNPGDVGFVEKLFNTFDKLAKRQDEDLANEKYDGAELFKIARKRNEEMRAEIDAIFEQPVCDSIFGKTNVFAIADGMPLWCNFLMAVIDEIDLSAETMPKQASQRVEAYTAKYSKYKKV